MEEVKSTNFIHEIIDYDLENGVVDRVHTRFPPEPNGYLHIGSAKAIYINYMTAKKYNGLFNLRYDDTNPTKEEDEYVRSIEEDLMWLGAYPNGGIFYGSDYFDLCYEYALKLIREGKAYVCDLSPEEMRIYRGTLTTPGKDSPYRNRSPEENESLFVRMKDGEFPDETRTLRAKIDMSSPNMNLRDPAIYRILHASHHRQGKKWCIYPLYDFAHPIQDATEEITHSLCSIEFENHRPLYDWVIEQIGFEKKPRQYEFARLNVTYTVMSKRYLRALVEEGLVDGWDDPRMPTISALRRRGYTPASIFDFIQRSGISKALSLCDINLLEHCIREELNTTAQRRIAVLDPLEIEITNYPEDKIEYFELSNNPSKEEDGKRSLPFTKYLYIEKDDFSDNPPPKFQRLKINSEVRLMGAYIIKCNEVIYKDNVPVKLLCTIDPETGGKNPPDGRKVRGTVHWLSKSHVHESEIHLYDNLFTIEDTNEIPNDKTFRDYINPQSMQILPNAKFELSLKDAVEGERFQFVRTGYFMLDSRNKGMWNRIVTLKDSFTKRG